MELIINYPSLPALENLATALGYYDPTTKVLTTTGAIATGGSYVANIVGQVASAPAVYDTTKFPPTLITPAVMAPGLWMRVRHNGDPALLEAQVTAAVMQEAAAAGIAVYTERPIGPKDANGNPTLAWTADGVTIAPAFVSGVGVIA